VAIICGGPTATAKEATTVHTATGRNESMSSEEWNKRHPERMRKGRFGCGQILSSLDRTGGF